MSFDDHLESPGVHEFWRGGMKQIDELVQSLLSSKNVNMPVDDLLESPGIHEFWRGGMKQIDELVQSVCTSIQHASKITLDAEPKPTPAPAPGPGLKPAPIPAPNSEMITTVVASIEGGGRWTCPKCSNVERGMIREVTDKTVMLSAYPLIYGKKLTCGKCGQEWRQN
jgi:hypothetical protein